MTIEDAIRAFHMMWGCFPEQVRLIHKDRTVLAVNRAAASSGLKTGVRCVEEPPKERHLGCLAAAALRERVGQYALNPAQTRIRFWIPVDGCAEDIYVHYSVAAALAPPAQ